MKTFSKFLSTLSLGAALCFAGPVVSSVSAQGPRPRGPEASEAQPQRGPHMRRGRRHHGRPFAELNLSDAQRAQMRTIHQEARQQFRQLRGSADEAAMRALRRQTFERVQGVLTPAQRTQAQELRAQHARQRLEHRLSRMTERLSLTPTQAQQVRGILSQASSQRRAIFEQSRLDETDPRASLEALRSRSEAQLGAVLSPEQMATLGEMRARHRQRGGRRGHR